MKLAIYRWFKRLFLGRWDRAYYFFLSLTFKEIEKKYGPQENRAW